MRLPAALALPILIAACASDPIIRYPVPSTPPAERVSIAYPSVEVREVSLPTYAELEEIAVEIDGGGISTSESLLWADDPARAVSLSLARALATITGAKVAPEPWPFQDFAAVRVEVRIEDMLATAEGEFRLSGQYFVAPDGPGRDRAAVFDLRIPLPDATPAAIARARGQAVAALAETIARDGLR